MTCRQKTCFDHKSVVNYLSRQICDKAKFLIQNIQLLLFADIFT